MILSLLPVRRLLNELHNLVIQTAALSRYFWPVRPAHEWRGAQLRERFGMSADSPLRRRDLRNAIEHFDEQLDLYLERGVVRHVLPEYVGPFEEQSGVRIHLFRAYYIDTGVFELLGKRYEMEPLAKEVGRVYAQLHKDGRRGQSLTRANALSISHQEGSYE